MNLFKLFWKKDVRIGGKDVRADCSVSILEPSKMHGMVSANVIVKVLVEGISISYDRERSATMDNFTNSLVIGAYHWANNRDNSTSPFVISYADIQNIYFWMYDEQSEKETIIREIVPDTIGLTTNVLAVIEYSNKAKGTKVSIGLRVVDLQGKRNIKATRDLYNDIYRQYMSTMKG